eukprot:294562_1
MEVQPDDITYNIAAYTLSKRQRKAKKCKKLQLRTNKLNNNVSPFNDKKSNRQSLNKLNRQYCSIGLKEVENTRNIRTTLIEIIEYFCDLCGQQIHHENLKSFHSKNISLNEYGVLSMHEYSFIEGEICDECLSCAICNHTYSKQELITIDCDICSSKLSKTTNHYQFICVTCARSSDQNISVFAYTHDHCDVCAIGYRDSTLLHTVSCMVCKASLFGDLDIITHNVLICGECVNILDICLPHLKVSQFCRSNEVHQYYYHRYHRNITACKYIPVVRKNMLSASMEWEFAVNWYGYVLNDNYNKSQIQQQTQRTILLEQSNNTYNTNVWNQNYDNPYILSNATICNKKYKIICLNCLSSPLQKCYYDACNNMDEKRFCANHIKCSICNNRFNDDTFILCEICRCWYCNPLYCENKCGTYKYCKRCCVYKEIKIYDMLILYLFKQTRIVKNIICKDVINIIMYFVSGHAIKCGNYKQCKNVITLQSTNFDWFPKESIFYYIHNKIVNENIINKVSYIHGVYIRAFCNDCYSGDYRILSSRVVKCKKVHCVNVDIEETCLNHKLFKCNKCNEMKVVSDETCMICGNCYCYSCIKKINKKYGKRSRHPMLRGHVHGHRLPEIVMKDGKCQDCYSLFQKELPKRNLLNCNTNF